ncbi:hypothetical protein EXIGLDRAFT_719240, partial [Exidia glandulosa HHB12029]
MLLETLPTELVLSILVHIERRFWINDIARLALVSRQFNQVFTPLLYRTVVLSNAKSVAAFHQLVAPDAPRTVLQRAVAFLSPSATRRKHERCDFLRSLVRNLSIWFSGCPTSAARGIICACPNLFALQLTPALSPIRVLLHLAPVPLQRLWIADSIADGPFMAGVDPDYLGTHLHLMDFRCLYMWEVDMEQMSCPNLTHFSTTCDDSYASPWQVVTVVQIILQLPAVQRVLVRVTCGQKDVTQSRVWDALLRLEDSRVFACAVPPPNPFFFAPSSNLESGGRMSQGLTTCGPLEHVSSQSID